MKYSATTKGFYDESIHGPRTIEIQDPSWVRPIIQVPLDDGNGGTVIIDAPDEDAIPPIITVPNPDCKIPSDAVEITEAEHAALLDAQAQGQLIQADASGRPVAVDHPPPTTEQIITGITAEIQKRLDDFAKTRGYDGILSACTYAASLVPAFKAEGQYCVEARGSTWAAAYAIMNAVQSGQRPMPALDEVIAELPNLVWPT